MTDDEYLTTGPLEPLIDSARQGNSEALGELLMVFRRYLVFLARTQLHHHMQAKADPSDLAQEACLAAHGNIANFKGQTIDEFTAWLRGILTNIVAMHLRKYLGTQKRDPRLEQNINHSLTNVSNFLQSGIAGDITSPSGNFERNEAFLRLAEGLEKLSDDYRRVIVLRNIEGMSFKEIAHLMGKTVNAVEKLWVRALAKLRENVGDAE
ncbi:ECF RNA polymerase sigma factor SigW [Polystyrenella longa]|uniref:ECF RNA polymerase sigma factor SigW n=1 Tax=Polystyrenella longa TaxID=2528007 RepID=A0A518CLL9_9PLAN|nr:sigma-70 family RNA polymerase sigma factor [Polystyrenella longa]QDU80117.1 ECF RNA polymerase sigma factor SigW [Polystyrenella longa]